MEEHNSMASDPPNDTVSATTENELAASLSNSLSSLNILNNEAVVVGARTDGRMAIVRRNFCLFVLFDFLLVSFIWLILEMLTQNGDLIDMFKREIFHYSIETSLFDLVMAAGCRFTILLLFYGLLQLETKIYVALTTAATCIFLIAKVLYFNWKASNQTAIQGSSLLVSFTIAWIEVWFLDLRVVPQEQHARDILGRGDLIRSEGQRIAREHYQQYAVGVDETLRRARSVFVGVNDPTGSSFYTPLDSHNASDNEDLDDPEEKEWLKLGKAALTQVSQLLEIKNWQNRVTHECCTVCCVSFSGGDYFKVETTVRGTPLSLHRELFNNIDEITSWNPALVECYRIATVNSTCDVLYQVTQKSFGISQRDLVLLRRTGRIGNLHVIAVVSTTHPNFPERRGIVRARCAPSCWAVRQHSTLVGMCDVIGIMNVDVKLTMPKKFMKAAVARSLIDVAAGIKRLADTLATFD